MRLSKSFKTKLLALFLLVSAIPLVLVVAVNAMNMIDDARQSVEEEGELRNRIVQDKISELYDKNINVLRVLAATPLAHSYLSEPSGRDDETMARLIANANDIFEDENNIIITDTTGQQLLRTDGLPLVNITQRFYFWEAMNGQETVSDVLVSLATGRLISVIEVPVLNAAGKAIGLVQRDFDLSELQEFVQSLATEQTSVLIIDRDGRIVAHSGRSIETDGERSDESGYEFVQRALAGEAGHLKTEFEGESSLVCYSRHPLMGWAIVTVQPVRYLHEQMYSRAVMAGGLGLFMLLLIAVAAYLLADKIAQPLVVLSKAMQDVAQSNQAAGMLQVTSNDELGQIAAALNEIQASQHSLRKESETDKLTALFNKSATERMCRERLAAGTEGGVTALYVIDLDHFKEANDTYGHQYGDKILQEFARHLKGIFRAGDCVGRFGGDEFIVCIGPLPEGEVVVRKAQQIVQMARALSVDGRTAGITASIGIAVAPAQGSDYETLFHAADQALYRVKENGRDGFFLA